MTDAAWVIITILICAVTFLLWTVREQGNYLSLLGMAHNQLRQAISTDLQHLNERFIEATNQRGIAHFGTPTLPTVAVAPHDVNFFPKPPDSDPDLPAQ